MQRRHTQFLCLGCFLSLFVCGVTAQEHAYEFDTPLMKNGRYLAPSGISNGGSVVGVTEDFEGFVLHNGELTTVRALGHESVLTAINPSATACVGWFIDSTNQQHSFEYRIGDGNIRLLPDIGGPGADTIAQDITDSGLIVGFNRSKDSVIREQGFILDGEEVQFITAPGALSTRLLGANNLGQMVGDFWMGPGNDSQPFLLQNAQLSPITVTFPHRSVSITDINQLGQIIGWAKSEEIESGAYGFLLDGDNQTLIRYPGPAGYYTLLQGINDFGQIVGGTGDNVHGFIATPRNAIPEPSSLALLLAGAPLLALRRRRG